MTKKNIISLRNQPHANDDQSGVQLDLVCQWLSTDLLMPDRTQIELLWAREVTIIHIIGLVGPGAYW